MRVLEFGDDTAAPYCGKLMARWGDEVIRVDLPDSPLATSLDLYLHPGKQRVALDYRSPEGRALLHRLAGRCDLIVSDCSPATLDEIGWADLGSGDMLARISITPFGLDGPYRDWKATGATLLALGGYSFLMGDPGKPPLTMPGRYVEYQSGQFAFIAALAAWLEREDAPATPTRTIEIAMLEVVASLSQFTTVMWTYNGRVRSRHGNRWENLHPICLYPCEDGWFLPTVVPAFWEPFTKLLGRPELVDDPRFATNTDRMANADTLDEIAVDAFKDKTMQAVLHEAQDVWRVPAGIVATLADVLDDEHLAERGFWREAEVPQGGTLRMPGSPLAFDGVTAPEPQPTAPGADTGAVLAGWADMESAG